MSGQLYFNHLGYLDFLGPFWAWRNVWSNWRTSFVDFWASGHGKCRDGHLLRILPLLSRALCLRSLDQRTRFLKTDRDGAELARGCCRFREKQWLWVWLRKQNGSYQARAGQSCSQLTRTVHVWELRQRKRRCCGKLIMCNLLHWLREEWPCGATWVRWKTHLSLRLSSLVAWKVTHVPNLPHAS